jgi:hypothetical protein
MHTRTHARTHARTQALIRSLSHAHTHKCTHALTHARDAGAGLGGVKELLVVFLVNLWVYRLLGSITSQPVSQTTQPARKQPSNPAGRTDAYFVRSAPLVVQGVLSECTLVTLLRLLGFLRVIALM